MFPVRVWVVVLGRTRQEGGKRKLLGHNDEGAGWSPPCKFALVLTGELTAGGGDVVPALNPLCHIDLVMFEDGFEAVDAGSARSLETVTGIDPVERDEVNDMWGSAH